MSSAVLLPFLITCLVIEVTPGPNMAYLAVLSAAEGRRAGFAVAFGIAAGLLMVGLTAALGVASLVSNSPFAYQVLRWAGVAYLLWLAWDGWREEPETSPGATGSSRQQNARYFSRGFMINLLNPKAAVFYFAILPKFVSPGDDAIVQAVTLTVIYVGLATAVHGLIVTLAATARQALSNRRRRVAARRVLSLALVVIAAWFAISTAGG